MLSSSVAASAIPTSLLRVINNVHKARLFCALVIVIALLGACTPQSPSVLPSSQPSSASSTVATVSQPKKAVVGIPQDLDSLDPHLSTATGTQEVMFNIFTGLVNTDVRGAIVPELAESWTISEDQLTYTFILRQGAVFHNGDPVRPQDVVYSYQRLRGQTGEHDSRLSSALDAVGEISFTLPNVVSLHLTRVDSSLLGKLLLPIIPEGSGPEQKDHPIGAGPFSFLSYTPGVGIRMVKHQGYYLPGQPYLDEVVFRICLDSNAAFLALQNGEIDILNVTKEQRDVLLNRAGIEVLATPQNMPQLMAFNLGYEPFADIRVRQAVNHAINKDLIIQMLAPGSQKLGTNFCEVMEFYAARGLEDTYPYDPQKARELLEEAGYSNLSFTLRVPSEYIFHLETAQLIQMQLNQVGVHMTIDPIPFDTWLDQVYTGFNHQATLIGLTGKLDPDAILGRFASNHRNNFMQYHNPEVDELLQMGRGTAIEAERAPYYKEIQTILAEEVPAVFIMDITLYRAVNSRLTGLLTYPIGYIDMKTVDLR
ncbi:MAG: ABC transporter substrate-binding protein [Symbiobacteriaceae bacterium]|nr:ABC transporter substrate-binding protein [Symbiobacteriaceae bacterium]